MKNKEMKMWAETLRAIASPQKYSKEEKKRMSKHHENKEKMNEFWKNITEFISKNGVGKFFMKLRYVNKLKKEAFNVYKRARRGARLTAKEMEADNKESEKRMRRVRKTASQKKFCKLIDRIEQMPLFDNWKTVIEPCYGRFDEKTKTNYLREKNGKTVKYLYAETKAGIVKIKKFDFYKKQEDESTTTAETSSI